MLTKEYYWAKLRGLDEARKLLVELLKDNLLAKSGCKYLETDAYNGIIETCKMLSREIYAVQKQIDLLQRKELEDDSVL